MTILCIETSTSVCSAAICKDGVPAKQCIHYEGSNHARLLPLYIDELLQYARENGLTIDAVALSEGPGSYTGLRIGTSTAKGLCYGLNVPLIPVPTLDVLCEAAKRSLSSVSAAVLIPMIDARRMEVYTAIFDSESKVESRKSEEERVRAVVVENEESFFTPSLLGEGRGGASYYYFGDGAAKCQAVLTSPNWHLIPNIVPEAQYMGALAENSRQLAISHQQLAYYEPFYLKEFVAAQSHVKGLK
jgi:tRNA threonylcarbamoyladenosine biosynthesis protein TsaB